MLFERRLIERREIKVKYREGGSEDGKVAMLWDGRVLQAGIEKEM